MALRGGKHYKKPLASDRRIRQPRKDLQSVMHLESDAMRIANLVIGGRTARQPSLDQLANDMKMHLEYQRHAELKQISFGRLVILLSYIRGKGNLSSKVGAPNVSAKTIEEIVDRHVNSQGRETLEGLCAEKGISKMPVKKFLSDFRRSHNLANGWKPLEPFFAKKKTA